MKDKEKNSKNKNLPVATTGKKECTPSSITRIKILEYLSNPENPFLRWVDIATQVCGYKKPNQLFETFTVEERRDMERIALEERRKNCRRQSAAVDNGLLKRAIAGDAAAAKLWYQRIEGWSETQKHEFPDENGKPQTVGNNTNILQISEDKIKSIIHDISQKI